MQLNIKQWQGASLNWLVSLCTELSLKKNISIYIKLTKNMCYFIFTSRFLLTNDITTAKVCISSNLPTCKLGWSGWSLRLQLPHTDILGRQHAKVTATELISPAVYWCKQGIRNWGAGSVYLWIKETQAYTPLHHYLMSPTRLQEQPQTQSNNWSRREASLKYLMTKGAVENIVGGEHTCMYCTQLERQQIHEMREGKFVAGWLKDTQITKIKI